MSGARSQGEYLERLAHNPVPSHVGIELAVRKLVALSPGARLNDPGLFDHRVASETVRAWRRGTRAAPQWALDLISAKLLAHGTEYLNAAAIVRSATPAAGNLGIAGKQALNRYRAAQAAKKQKAGG